MSRWRFCVLLTAGLAIGWFALRAAPRPLPAPFPSLDGEAIPGPSGTDQTPPSRVRVLSRPDAFSSSADWVFNYGDLSLSDGVCENRSGQDSRMHFISVLPNDCELTVRVLLLDSMGDHTQCLAIHFGAAGPKDDLNDSGYGVILQRSSNLQLVKARNGNMEVIDVSPVAALNAIPMELKIKRSGDQIQVFADGNLRISARDGAYNAGGYLSLRTTQYPGLSGGRSRWRFEKLSYTCYKR